MKSRYLVRPTEKEDWLSCTETETELSVCLLHPVGPNAMLEVRDGLYKQGNSEPYHQHDVGSEIFYLREGTVEITIRGLRVPMQAGDMGDIHARLHRLLDNGDLLLRSFTFTDFLP